MADARGGLVFERFRTFAERLDFWAATEAGAIRKADKEDGSALPLAHYAEYLWPAVGDFLRYHDA